MKNILTLGQKTCIDLNVRSDGNQNVLVVGGSGRGKSHSFVKPNLLNWMGEATLVVADPKGALEKEFGPYFKKNGYRTYSLDLIKPSNSKCGFNPMDHITCEEDFIKLAHVIVYSGQEVRTCTHMDPYWNQCAEILLSAIMSLVYATTKDGEETFEKVLDYLAEATNDNNSLINSVFEKMEQIKGNVFPVRQWKKMKTVKAADKTWAGIVSTAESIIGRYDSEEVRKLFTNKNRICFEEFLSNKSILFVKASDTESTYYNLASIFYGQFFEHVARYADGQPDGKCPIPVKIIMDDFATNVFVEGMPRIISTMRARNVSAVLICQSVQQLRMGYGDDAQTIMASCDYIVFFGTNDIETAREFSVRSDKPLGEVLYQKRGMVMIFIAGEYPVEDERYDYRLHERYKALQALQREK